MGPSQSSPLLRCSEGGILSSVMSVGILAFELVKMDLNLNRFIIDLSGVLIGVETNL